MKDITSSYSTFFCCLVFLLLGRKKESIQRMGSPLEDKAFAFGLSMRAQKHEVLTEPRFQLVSQIVLWYHLITWTTWNFLGCFYQQQRNTGKQNPCKQWILPPLRGQKNKCNGLRVWPTLNSQQFRFSCPLQITLFRWSKNISYTPTWKFLLAGDYSLNFLKKKKALRPDKLPFQKSSTASLTASFNCMAMHHTSSIKKAVFICTRTSMHFCFIL